MYFHWVWGYSTLPIIRGRARLCAVARSAGIALAHSSESRWYRCRRPLFASQFAHSYAPPPERKARRNRKLGAIVLPRPLFGEREEETAFHLFFSSVARGIGEKKSLSVFKSRPLLSSLISCLIWSEYSPWKRYGLSPWRPD